MSYLRRKLDRLGPPLIRTVRLVGYALREPLVSLRARLLLVLAGLAVAGLLVADVVTYAALRSFLVDRVDRTLSASARTLQQPLGAPRLRRPAGPRGLAELAPGVQIQTRDATGDVIGSTVLSGAAGAGEPVLPTRLPAARPLHRRAPGAEARASVCCRCRSTSAARWCSPRRWTTSPPRCAGSLLIELVVSLLVVAAIVGVGWWLVRVGLWPLTRIGETAAAIGAGDLSRRVETGAGPRTEVGRLASALNAMLGQLEAAFAERTASERAAARASSATPSHELRTPLTAVQAYAELFERGARERPEDLARAMAGIERESQRMGALVDELLLLARLDQGRPLERGVVDVAAVARDAVDAARAVEPTRPWSLAVPDRLEVVGDETRLRQVLDNLLGNVRSHTPVAAPAHVGLSRRGEAARDRGGRQRPGPVGTRPRRGRSSASTGPTRRGRATAAARDSGSRLWPRSRRPTGAARRSSRGPAKVRGSRCRCPSGARPLPSDRRAAGRSPPTPRPALARPPRPRARRSGGPFRPRRRAPNGGLVRGSSRPPKRLTEHCGRRGRVRRRRELAVALPRLGRSRPRVRAVAPTSGHERARGAGRRRVGRPGRRAAPRGRPRSRRTALLAGADARLQPVGLRLGDPLVGQRLVDLGELGVADRGRQASRGRCRAPWRARSSSDRGR